MAATCDYVSKRYLPLYRAFIAEELVNKYSFTQKQAAQKLGTTQPAISQYLSSKRGSKNIQNYDEVAPLIKETAAKEAKKVAKTDTSQKEVNSAFCDLCRFLQKTGRIPTG